MTRTSGRGPGPTRSLRILVVNAGSSSLKLAVLEDGDRVLASENLPAPRGRVDEDALRQAIDRSPPIEAVGHRIVHGGTEFVEAVLLSADVVQRLRALTDLAPLHQPKSLRGVEVVSRALPDVPAVGCFDTAFHAGMPAAASTYALPPEWRKRWDLRRFGFHGLSHAWASRRAADLMGRPVEDVRVVTCHLGAGGSLCAVHGGRSVDTTMGFTPLEGLVMATRSGSVDPGLLLWLEEHVGMPPSELASTLEHRSGLLGLTGTADMRSILQTEADGSEEAAIAVEVYLHRLRAAVAAMAAAMDGLDALVFTGGVGEGSAVIRSRTARGLGFLGVEIDEDANAAPDAEADIGAGEARVRMFVVRAREDLEIARQVTALLDGRAGRPES
ncbi:MAG TPA: acetate/propionate family kinase [Actinomycetota bacterium]